MADFEDSKPRIIIIGGGISGISAGHDLWKAGLTNFVILEATNRIGGRIKSIDIGKNKTSTKVNEVKCM